MFYLRFSYLKSACYSTNSFPSMFAVGKINNKATAAIDCTNIILQVIKKLDSHDICNFCKNNFQDPIKKKEALSLPGGLLILYICV